ncbi:PQQ-dependent sugar dehydrogenase [Paracoccus denitrificans]|jgi:glucose/arabinose dehydrogenase|uniref:Glucose sorbosone dehydrogenase n=1 Tax=Paracoccus denitrificans (strain Pd 1222) TaxID=318586 RepID=A1B5K0_PARDP|nr:PQQ-dependent sugar dehydrogenase [Paracoccus denitrificans]ABL70794.1 glucose sorbosone dehydrogenase [Paracoccus denitrificans PD1222]MBB4627593.1 glucose/arabinose dehydrogenase [Paracoccus denitrificans]MCU7431524.1 PQQ-dependent sugar dehydrogenase [Paracoccus denitrificans]QAR26116.1 PQQ-dependent sugar dehydrogenase [Paracoccus denitrificans]UPV95031.1 PQQ-dependent sugar dehydrogenase [Paracoccus denitrificans]
MMPRRALAASLALCLAALPALAELNDRPPNARGQEPAFPGQTRAAEIDQQIPISRTPLIRGLGNPWGMALLPDGGLLITERPGTLRLYRDGRLSEPIRGLPRVDARGQGGLLDVAVAPDFASTRQVWFSFSEPRGNGRNATAVGTGRLSDDGTALEEMRVLFRQEPAWASTLHFGSRLVFDRQGRLFVTTGERSRPEPRQLAQDLNTHLGKVLRIDPATGAPAPGNPFSDGQARPEIWSWGHRNIQAAALDAQGRLWTVEHGPQGGDELNRPEPGRNYGWPVITYGQDYSGAPIGQGITSREGMEQPVYYWDPVIAPSGMLFYDGAMFPELRGDALIGGLQAGAVVRLRIEGDRVTGEQRLVEGIGRVRDIELAPDGALLILTDAGELIRLARG